MASNPGRRWFWRKHTSDPCKKNDWERKWLEFLASRVFAKDDNEEFHARIPRIVSKEILLEMLPRNDIWSIC